MSILNPQSSILHCTLIMLAFAMGFNLYAAPADTSAYERFDVYLCLGQSNMEGSAKVEEQDRMYNNPRFVVMCGTAEDAAHNGRQMGEWYTAEPPLCRWYTGLGPADYFGRAMVEALPQHVKVGVIVVACGGIGIEGLSAQTDSAYYATAADWMQGLMRAYDKSPYTRLVALARKAQRDGGVIRGILLHQGETNNGQRDWPAKVDSIYRQLLADLNLDAQRVPLLVGEMLQGGHCVLHNQVIAIMPQVIPTAHVVSSQDCPGAPDGLHFTPEGYRILGRRYAEEMLKLLR